MKRLVLFCTAIAVLVRFSCCTDEAAAHLSTDINPVLSGVKDEAQDVVTDGFSAVGEGGPPRAPPEVVEGNMAKRRGDESETADHEAVPARKITFGELQDFLKGELKQRDLLDRVPEPLGVTKKKTSRLLIEVTLDEFLQLVRDHVTYAKEHALVAFRADKRLLEVLRGIGREYGDPLGAPPRGPRRYLQKREDLDYSEVVEMRRRDGNGEQWRFKRAAGGSKINGEDPLEGDSLNEVPDSSDGAHEGEVKFLQVTALINVINDGVFREPSGGGVQDKVEAFAKPKWEDGDENKSNGFERTFELTIEVELQVNVNCSEESAEIVPEGERSN